MKIQNVIQLPGASRVPAPPSPPPGDAAPFRPVAGPPSPAFVPFPRWQTACNRASAAILAGERRLLVVGPAGTGKTLLIEHVARILRAAGWEAAVRLAGADPQPPAEGPSAALLVDEADRLPREALQHLLRDTPGPLVLAGLDVLAAHVPGATRIALTGLEREEARDYIAQWLALTRRTPAQLEPAATRRAIELSSGVPRLLSTLLAASAWLAEAEGAAVISLQHVDDAGALRLSLAAPEAEPGTDATAPRSGPADDRAVPARRMPAYVPALAAILLLGAGGFLAARLFPAAAQHAADRVRAYAVKLGPAASPAPAANAPEPESPAQIALAAAPEPSPAAPPAPAAAAALPTPVAPSAALPASLLAVLLERGREMLAIGDISAARLLFRRAAEAGSAEAMLAMGRTFDPVVLAGSDTLLTPDPAEASRWYRRAARAGSTEAAAMLH